jgi:hypothetical protein
MSTLAVNVAIVTYGIVMVCIVAFFVKDANRNEALYRRTLGRLSAMYVRNSELEAQLAEALLANRLLRRELEARKL